MLILHFGNHTTQSEVLKILENGGVVVYPTDTVYGLLCDATNAAAVEKLISFKNRPAGKPISIFVDSLEMLNQVVTATTDQQSVLETLLPGPYTVILPSKGAVCQALESERGTLGVRLPRSPQIIELVCAFGKPLTATSANLSGNHPHYSAEALLNSLSEKKKGELDAVVDGGSLPHNKPSTVIDLTQDTIQVLRAGDIPWKPLKTVVTHSPEETRSVAKELAAMVQSSSTDKPVAVVLQGELGAGKTEFVKGLAEQFKITDISSPTFVVYYEYPLATGPFTKLVHFDLYNIQDEVELEVLKVAELLKPKTLLLFEWGEKLGSFFQKLSLQAQVFQVSLQYRSETEREITLSQL